MRSTLLAALCLATALPAVAHADAADDRTTALVDAVEHNDAAAIRKLIKAGADPNRPYVGNHETAFHMAAEGDEITAETLALLLQLGGNPTLPCPDGHLALWHAAINSESHSVRFENVKILGPASSKAARLDGLMAVLRGHPVLGYEDVVHYLVEELKVDINGAVADGETPLMAAARAHRAGICEYLVAHGAKLETRDKKGQTALSHAVTDYAIIMGEGDEGEFAEDFTEQVRATVQSLLAAGADAKTIDGQGRTLLIAYLTGESWVKLATVRLLVKAGTPLDVRDQAGKTALDYVPARDLPKRERRVLRKLLTPATASAAPAAPMAAPAATPTAAPPPKTAPAPAAPH